MQLVDSIYSAAYGSGDWTSVMQGVRSLFGGARACIAAFGTSDLRAVSHETHDDPQFTTSLFLGAYTRDPLAIAEKAMAVGKSYSWDEIVDTRALHGRELWNDVYHPMGLHESISCKLFENAQAAVCIHVTRTQTQPSFSTSERRLFDRIVPHLLRAGEMERAIGKTSSLVATFAQMQFGIILLDGHCRLGWMNEAAEAILSSPSGPLKLSDGQVCTAALPYTAAFQELVGRVCTPHGMVSAGGTLLLSVSAGGGQPARQYGVSVAPLPGSSAYGLMPPGSALVMISGISSAVPDQVHISLRQLFSLTRAEARLAALIAGGLSLKEAAERAGIGFGTARNYLIRIFRKTGTNQQTALVALIKSLPPLP
ncbi:hypothetical protein [Pannonibacter sp.]|uniref:hypothetical protein n=1 Tax=Pannonibacter sp. TaxID=1906786 RepID=UPI003F700F12